jgi:hypothetical protein
LRKIVLRNKLEVLVDEEDFELLNSFKWGIIKNKTHTYAARGTRKNGVYSKILMHRFIMNAPKDQMVDHRNGNTLDNRKSNLRLATRAMNLQNSKLRSDSNCKYKGVSKRGHKFVARIQVAVDKRLFLGYFKTEEEAAKAYNKAATEHFGEFANLNKIDG